MRNCKNIENSSIGHVPESAVKSNVQPARVAENEYGYYSRVLKQPFDSVKELKEAEAKYYAEIRAKEDRVATKKADAQKVEEAFKALNAARKAYKETLQTITKKYHEGLKNVQATFEDDKAVAHNLLANAEEAYSAMLKAFTEKYPEGYHLTLKDGDFETTIESHVDTKETSNGKATSAVKNLFDLFDVFYSF